MTSSTHSFTRVLVLAACVSVLAGGLATPTANALVGDVTMVITPGGPIPLGDPFTVDIFADVGTDILSNYTFFIDYDETHLEPTSFSGGTSSDWSTLNLGQVITPGRLGVSQVNALATSTGILNVASIDFSTLTAGQSLLQLTVSSIGVAPDGDSIPTNTIDVQITVEGTNTPPVLTVTPPTTIDLNVGDSYVDPGATALDAEDGDLTGSIVVGGDTVDTNTAGTYVVTYSVTDSGGLSDDGSRTVNVNSAVFDLGITVESNVTEAAPGEVILYLITVTNVGGVDATNAIVSAPLPAELIDASTDGCTQDPDGIPICTLGAIAAGGMAEFTLSATAASITGDVVLTATVDGIGQTDDNPANDSDSATVAVARATLCEDFESGDLEAQLNLIGEIAGDGDGLPMAAAIALVELLACSEMDFITDVMDALDTATEIAYQANQDVAAGSGIAALATVQKSVAILMALGGGAQTATIDALNANLAIDISAVVGWVVVEESGDVVTPQSIEGRAISEAIIVFEETSTRGGSIDEPYTGSYDLDGDGDSNAVEYDDIVTIGGGTLEAFALLAAGIVGEPPVITLIDDAEVETLVGEDYEDAGATASDPEDGDITGDIVVGGLPIDTSVESAGNIVTYDVMDSVGNTAVQVTRTVDVVTELTDTSSSSSGSCFIATAAYGTPMANEIRTLRVVRDRYMLNSAIGSAFVDTYYRLSPPVARNVSDSAVLATVVRALLVPVLLVSELLLVSPLLALTLLAVGISVVMARLRKRRTTH